jgi:subtilisin family serine protease
MRRKALLSFIIILTLVIEVCFTSVALAGKPSPPGEKLPWGVDRIDADLVWGTTKGAGVKVAILDTGIYKGHPDLDTTKGINFVDYGDYPNPDDPNENGSPDNYGDTHGHGTALAGVIAAIDNDIGVIGVGPEIEIWTVRFRKTLGIYPDSYPDLNVEYNFTDLCEGMDWCLSNGIQVINFSLGLSTIKYDQNGNPLAKYRLHDWQFYSKIRAAAEQGIIMVAAAGNDGRRIETFDPSNYLGVDYEDVEDRYMFPASYPEVIAVSATGIKKVGKTTTDYVASWSNYGPAIDLSAPGNSIYTTYLNNGYTTVGGTSLSCPHVVGTAALLLAIGEPASSVRERLIATAEDLGAQGKDDYFGYGLVDAQKAVFDVRSAPPLLSSDNKLSVTWGKLKGN